MYQGNPRKTVASIPLPAYSTQRSARRGRTIIAKILVVDDEPMNTRLIAANLEPLQSSVVEVHSGKAAIQACQQHEFAVILLDVAMPVMDGIETAKAIRSLSNANSTPIIFITGHAGDANSIMEGYASGAVDYLVKPVNFKILRSKVKTFIDLYDAHQKYIEEKVRRCVLEEQHRSLAHFVEQLRSGEIDTITGGDSGQKLFRLLDQNIIDQNNQLLTQLKSQKASLEESNSALRRANQDLDDYSHAASHDLRQPLRSILGVSKLALEDLEDADYPAVEKGLNIIMGLSERLANLVDGMLSLAHIDKEPLELKPTALTQCVSACLTQLQTDILESEATIEIAERLPSVLSDELHLTRTLQNVIHNSIKYRSKTQTPHIIISAQLSPDDQDNSYCALSIEDNGLGIDPQYRDSVFKPFVRLHSSEEYSGSGLGLAAVKKTMEQLRGTVRIEDANTLKGTRFIIELPLVRSTATTEQNA